MKIAKQNYLKKHRFSRYKYLYRGGKHKINRNKWCGGYKWITPAIVSIPSWDGDYYSPLEYEITDNADYFHATILKNG